MKLLSEKILRADSEIIFQDGCNTDVVPAYCQKLMSKDHIMDLTKKIWLSGSTKCLERNGGSGYYMTTGCSQENQFLMLISQVEVTDFKYCIGLHVVCLISNIRECM
jgi:hypothetical protein